MFFFAPSPNCPNVPWHFQMKCRRLVLNNENFDNILPKKLKPPSLHIFHIYNTASRHFVLRHKKIDGKSGGKSVSSLYSWIAIRTKCHKDNLSPDEMSQDKMSVRTNHKKSASLTRHIASTFGQNSLNISKLYFCKVYPPR